MPQKENDKRQPSKLISGFLKKTNYGKVNTLCIIQSVNIQSVLLSDHGLIPQCSKQKQANVRDRDPFPLHLSHKICNKFLWSAHLCVVLKPTTIHTKCYSSLSRISKNLGLMCLSRKAGLPPQIQAELVQQLCNYSNTLGTFTFISQQMLSQLRISFSTQVFKNAYLSRVFGRLWGSTLSSLFWTPPHTQHNHPCPPWLPVSSPISSSL